MRNLANTEKSLKHWLKNKVTITTATVVGFLIMGTVSFGGETHHVTKTETLSTSVEVTKDEDTVGVSIDTENVTLTNGSTITATSNNNKAFGIKSDVKANVINNGTITVKALNQANDTLEAGRDLAIGIILNKGGQVDNNNSIDATGYRATGIEVNDGAVATNNKDGKITATSVGNRDNAQGRTSGAIGMKLNDSTGVNEGEIITTSKDLSQGVNVYISKNFISEGKVFENNGTIMANGVEGGGGSSNAIYIKNNTDKNIEIVNGATGILKTDDKSNISSTATVKIDGYNEGEKGLTTFVNEGKILTENNGIGIYSQNKKSSIINSGDIIVSGDGITSGVKLIGSKSETSKITLLNTGNINVTNNNNKENGNNSSVKDTGIAFGVELRNGATATNSGTITATSPDRAVGVDIYLDKDYKGNTEKLFVNEKGGTITANSTNGATANAISVTNKSNQKVTIENNGTLISNGKNGTNTANGKPLYNPVVNLAGQNVEFTNNGTIVAGDGVGIAVNGSNSNLSATNNGTIKVNSTGKAVISYGTATNNGVIQITDKTAEQLKNEKFDANSLFTGNVTGDGMVADKEGYAVNATHDNTIAGIKVTTGDLNKYTGNVFFGEHKGSTIIGDETPTTNINTLNIIGKVAIENGQNSDGAKLAINTLNFDANGQFNVGAGNTLVLGDQNKNITVNATETQNRADIITLENGAELGLQNATINKGANISGEGTVSATGNTTINSNVTSKEFEVFDGNVLFNGVLSSDTVTVEKVKKDTKLTLSSGASFGKATTLNTTNGTTVFEIGAKGENTLANSKGTVTVTGNIDFDTNNLTTNTTVKLNNEKEHIEHNLSGAKYQDKTDGVYNTHLDKGKNTLELTYNKALYNDTPELNALNNIMQGLNDKLSQNVTERANQLDEIYAGNIYSETVRAGYDNIKLNEETVLSLGKTAKAGELKTHGKALYTKDEYTRNGALNNFDADVETTGLFAGAEYGLSDTMSVGAVFSGAKQDVNVPNGSADGDLFYLGVYGTKVVGNYDFTAGLGYQLGKYDADYNMAKGLTASEKYDSNAVNGYVQGRYTANLGDGLSVQPKVKLGYTYIEQDDVNDNNYKVSDAEVSTFDTEVGVDVVKSVQFEKSKLDVKFGTSYIKAMGDTDKKFTLSTKDGSAEILGAELAENTLKFALDAEVENENGFFYNAGVNYRFGSEDTEAYSVNAGIGYKF